MHAKWTGVLALSSSQASASERAVSDAGLMAEAVPMLYFYCQGLC